MQELDYSLPVGSQIGDYRILTILGVGGFGITYKAEDTRMQRLVALKEFLPQELAGRSSDASSVIPKTNCADDYQYGLTKFLDEARTLAKFNHPNIVRAYTFIEENGTAYLVMEYVEGEALDEHLKKIHFNGNMAESRIREIIEPVLKGLIQVHKAGLLHRDIKPGNIYLQSSTDASNEHGNNPMLIDFGAARQSVGEKSKSISAIISQGYAPPEQYTTRGKQGPYTDIYAIGAVMYYLVTGTKPVESTDRQHDIMDEQPDPLTPIEKNRGYSDALINAITQSMVLRISNRTQNVEELQNTLSGGTNKAAVVGESKSVEQGNDATKKITSSTDKAIIQSSVASSQYKEAQPQKNKAIWLILFLLLLGGGSFYGYQEYQKDIAAQEQEVLQIRHIEQQDIEAWNQAKEINSHYVYRSYLNAWPQGKFKGKAEQAIASLVTAKKLAQQDIIKEAQGLLQQLGYKVSETGNLNEKTVNAIENFETKQNVVVTGQVNNVLITSLKAALKHYKKQLATKALTVKRQKKYEIAPKSKHGREKHQFYKHFNIIDNRENNFPDWLLTPVCENATCSATVMEFNSDNSWQKNTALCAFEAITDASLLRSVEVRSLDNYSTNENSSGQIESSFEHVGRIIVDEVFDGFTVKILVEDYAELINSNASVSSNTQTTLIKLDGSLAALSFESIAYSTSEENGINESIQLKDDISTEELTQLFDLFSQNNLNVIRFWTNTESKNKYLACLLSRPFKPDLGVEL